MVSVKTMSSEAKLPKHIRRKKPYVCAKYDVRTFRSCPVMLWRQDSLRVRVLFLLCYGLQHEVPLWTKSLREECLLDFEYRVWSSCLENNSLNTKWMKVCDMNQDIFRYRFHYVHIFTWAVHRIIYVNNCVFLYLV